MDLISARLNNLEKEIYKKIKLGTSGDAPSITPEVIRQMKEAGFEYISVGGESGSDKVLRDDIGKGVTVAHNLQAINIMRENLNDSHFASRACKKNNICDVISGKKAVFQMSH